MYIRIYMCNTLTLQILECTYNCHTCTYHVFILVQVYACVYESVVEVQSVARSLQAKNKAYTGIKGGFSNTHTHTHTHLALYVISPFQLFIIQTTAAG